MRLFGPMIMLMLVEIALFVTLGGQIGLLASLAVIFGSAALGVLVLRGMGQRMAAGLQAAMASARGGAGAPLGAQALLGLAGVLLIMPGFLGDAAGLILLLPPVRAALVAAIARRMPVAEVSEFDLHRTRRHDVVIDGEFIELDPDAPPLPRSGRSGWTRD